jgi:hypothetical protein
VERPICRVRACSSPASSPNDSFRLLPPDPPSPCSPGRFRSS